MEDADPASTLTYYRQLLAFRRGHAVWCTGATRLVALDSNAVVSYVREDAMERYLVAVNLTDEDQDALAADALPAGGELAFGDGTLEVSGGMVHVKLPGKAGAVFKISSP